MRVAYRRLRLIESALAGGRRSWVDCATPLERALCRSLSNEERTELAEALLEAERERCHHPAETAGREAFVSLFGKVLEKLSAQGEQAQAAQDLMEAADGDPEQAARRWLESSSAEERMQFARHLRFGHPREAAWWVRSLMQCVPEQELARVHERVEATCTLEPLERCLREVWRRRADLTCHCPWRSVGELLAALALD